MARVVPKKLPPNGADLPDGLVVWTRRFIEHMRLRAYSEQTVHSTEGYLHRFTSWAYDRGLTRPSEITKPILETYQRWLFYYRRRSGKPLTFGSQALAIQKLKNLFRWLAKTNVILSNPASELDPPRVERRVPKAILTEREVERVLAVPDTTDPLGVRDRAIMETLYSTGIRRFELAGLQLFDLDTERGTLTVRLGKGGRDRTVPIGERALMWIGRYTDEVRPTLVVPPDDGTLFLSELGEALKLEWLTRTTRRYLSESKVGKNGACHIFRHSMATVMLEHGADVRVIQEILGHSQLSTTAIYTRVSIQRLKIVHDQTHPTAHLDPKKTETTVKVIETTEEELLSTLEDESVEDDE